MNSVIKSLVAVFSLVLLFACGGGGEEVSAVSTQPASTAVRMKALAAGVVPDSGTLGTAVNSRFAQCMDTAWNSWFKPSKYAQCVGEGYRVLFEESGIGNQLLDSSQGHQWLPEKGRVTIGGNFILVQFKLDTTAVNFFKTKFVGSNTRLPIGLEIDISPLNNDVFRKAGSVIGLNLPNDAEIFLDTSAFDAHPGYGAVIRNPHKLQAGVSYAVIFHTEGAPWYDPGQGDSLVKADGDVRLMFQVSIDKPKANSMIAAYDAGDHQLNGFSSDGGGGGFSYFVTASDGFDPMNLPSQNRICWYAKLGNDIGCSGGNPLNQPLAETVITANGAVPQGSVSSGDAILQSGTVAIPGQGPGGYPALTDEPVQEPPDFVTKRSWLETPWGVETYKYGRTETVKMKGQFKNEGSGPCLSTDATQTIIVHAYLSNGYKEDAHSDWKRVGTDEIQCANMQPGDTHTETEGIELWRDVPGPGIYNIVWCIDHPLDDHNNGGDHREKHESNNCSTEAVFEVVEGTVNVPNTDLITFGLTVIQAPVYAGDPIRLGAWVKNQGAVNAIVDIRSSYTVSCNGGPTTMLTDDGTMATTLVAGASAWEEILTPVLMPNVVGTCTLTFTADYLGAQPETDETNNSTSITVTLAPRPAPILSITKFQDQIGCCTTNTGSRIKPDIWVYNGGSVAPASNVTVIYHISSPVATGGAYIYIGYGVISPSELPPGGTDEDYMEGSGFQIPQNSAWKLQWHTIRGCIKPDGSTPVGGGPGEVCAYYSRYSKK